MTSTPSSTTSGCLSGEDTSEDHLLPSNLAAEELRLALNKEASEEELQRAIARCKELVLESEVVSSERKWLVRHLIELRLRLQECQEALADPQHPRNKNSGLSKRSVLGHHFQLQSLLKIPSSKYCDHCTGSIWHLVQAWYKCEDCGFNVHHKCIPSVVRECAHIVASEKGYELNICPEEGLSAQKYLCAECKTPLPVGANWTESEARLCDYSGLYYCSACHWGSSAVIPARITHNWDFNSYPVSQASLQLLKITAERPLVHLEKLNPKLFVLVQELRQIKRMRQELYQMKRYLLVCRNAETDHFLWKHVDTPYLIDYPNLYSLQDLLDINTGELLTKLLNLTSIFLQHIKDKCELCKGRGHICEICSNDEILHPFDSTASTCNDCNAVLHKICVSRKKSGCPKCVRLQKRKEQETNYIYKEEDF